MPTGSRFGLSIRAADASDAGGLTELLAEAGLLLEPASLAERIELVRRGPGTILIAEEWGPPTGVIELAVVPTIADAQPVGRVGLLFVGTEARRRGIGRLLLKTAAQSARSAGCDTLLADTPDGCGLAPFWEANGFSMAGTSRTRPLRKKS